MGYTPWAMGLHTRDIYSSAFTKYSSCPFRVKACSRMSPLLSLFDECVWFYTALFWLLYAPLYLSLSYKESTIDLLCSDFFDKFSEKGRMNYIKIPFFLYTTFYVLIIDDTSKIWLFSMVHIFYKISFFFQGSPYFSKIRHIRSL